MVVIFVLAFLLRLIPTQRGGGIFGLQFYDDGVHYAAAVGLVHGRFPYRDFLLLHPPGILLLLAPFAELGRALGDGRSFALARLCFMALGAVNAVLVSRFLRPVGVFAAWFGGLTYAVFWPAVYSEHTVLLEGPANTGLLVALILLTPVIRGAAPSNAQLLTAGGLLGFATTIKIWGVVPVVLLAVWLALPLGPRRAGLRRSALFLAGAAGVTTAVCLPFFVTAPSTMWRMVVRDQLQRMDTGFRGFERVNEIAGLDPHGPPDQWSLLLVSALAVMLAGAVAACFHPRTRSSVLLLLGLVGLLLLTPSWFLHYSALTAPLVAIVVGAGGQQLLRVPGVRGFPALRVVLGLALLTGLVAYAAPVPAERIGQRFPGRTLGSAVAARPGCVTTDHAATLILMDVLSRNLERGCPLVVDLGGASYDLPSPQRGLTSRRKNEAFQSYALGYLRTGDTMILARFYPKFGLSSDSFATVDEWPVLTRAGEFALREPHGRIRRKGP